MSKLKITLVLKHTFCFTLLIGCLNNNLFSQRVAQPTPLKKWSFGFDLSNNYAWYKQMDGAMENNGLGVGFSYGLSADYRLTPSPNYWGSIEALITTAPLKIKNTGELKMNSGGVEKDFTNTEFNYKVQYVQIPVCFMLKTQEIGHLKYYFKVGVAPSMAVNTRLKTVSTPDIYANTPNVTVHDPNDSKNSKFDFDGGVNSDANYRFSDDVNPMRWSLIYALGIEYPLAGNVKLIGGVRFDNGVTDYLSDRGFSGRHNFFAINVGVQI
ncbi:MAG: porin family protein [Bacteroidia bacterium]